ncbi:hypothetical protein C8J56DRAFT_1109640 [Mycena floridula]|nr:hypothetical protein C8J56DRAFT_1109640 [Mycena floridula]
MSFPKADQSSPAAGGAADCRRLSDGFSTDSDPRKNEVFESEESQSQLLLPSAREAAILADGDRSSESVGHVTHPFLSRTMSKPYLSSTKSINDNMDLFIFFQLRDPIQPCKLVVGLSLARHPHITISTLYRWLYLIEEDAYPEFARKEIQESLGELQLRPVEVFEVHLLWYRFKPSGPVLDRHLSEPVSPGVYAGFSGDEEYGAEIGSDRLGTWGFSTSERHMEKSDKHFNLSPAESELRHNFFPSHIIAQAEERDHSRCLITNSQETRLMWIIPPTWSPDLSPLSSTERSSDDIRASYTTVDNVMTVDSLLYPLFMDNAISIDVDDDYRVIKFTDIPEGIILPSYMPQLYTDKPSSERPGDFFLRNHLKWSLWARILGGDIKHEYTNEKMENLWVRLNRTSDLSDPLWEEPMAKEILPYMTTAALRMKERFEDGEDDR